MEMERPFICGGNKYIIISVTNTIGLPVFLENLPKEIIVEGNKLLLKPSFHVSLVCINEIVKKHKLSIPDFKDSVLKDFCDFIEKNDVNLLGHTEEFKFATKNDPKTIVVMCKVSNLPKFFEIINKKYGLEIEYPPTHITLYAHDGKTGIFLTDSNDIKSLTKPIVNPIGRLL